MTICVVGPGRIGGNLARRFAQAGHDVVGTFAGHPEDARAALARDGVAFESDGRRAASGAGVVVISVPWKLIDDAWASVADALAPGTVVVDTTNPFGDDGLVELPATAAAFNARRFGPRPYAKAFNTLTASFQAAAAARPAHHRAAMFYVATDAASAAIAETLIDCVGFVPVAVGAPDESAIMEAPRRPGAAYGEEYTPEGARALIASLDRGSRPSSPR